MLAVIPAVLTVLVLALPSHGAVPPTSHRLTPGARALRERVYATDSCLAAIVDVEDPSWDPTVSFGGRHFDTSVSYGLPQADPGSKMVSAGRGWETDPFVQLRWMRRYVIGRYGSSCAAWAWRQSHGWY